MVTDQGHLVSPLVDEFCQILEKNAGGFGSAMELGGLGLLASLHMQRGQLGKYIQSTKGGRIVDLAGLGLLGAPSAVELAHSAISKLPRRKRKRKL